MFTQAARAKVNLNLHVGRLIREPDHKHLGYHPLSSLVAFADFGDELSCKAAKETTLEISGPYANDLSADKGNLVLKAYDIVTATVDLPPLKFHLVKNLPVASGIGGGSADAAAALRLLGNYAKLPKSKWMAFAKSLGADVPVCYESRTCLMTGIGEDLEHLPNLPAQPAVLVNPGKALSTGAVFKTFDKLSDTRDIHETPLNIGPSGRNDLQSSAIDLEPVIKDCLESLKQQSGCTVHRMSGSGATCFGLFDNLEAAKHAGLNIQSAHPDWWVKAVTLGTVIDI